ncbi:MAG TPA: ATP-binding protein [Pyrinomonadaceae bacterium]|nr:ATP-binding protein [Pyrinomonadaceae bacterium]
MLVICAALAAGAVAALVWNLNVGLGLALALLAGAGLMSLPAHQKEPEESAFSSPVRAALQQEREAPNVLDAHAETLLAAMMNGMHEGMLVVDEEMRVIASNRAAREIFKQVEGELERARLSELTRNPAIHSAFTASLNDSEQAETKVEMQGAGGPIYDLRVVPLRLNGETGSSRGAFGVFFDITRLERLERVRQEFLSNVSHELRTPLTAIIAFVETLEDGAIEDQGSNRRFLSIIRRNAERMHNLIDDILELSAIEAGRVQIEAEPLSLHHLVNDILTALASRTEASGIKLKNEVPTDVTVFADPRRLEQMITNLTHNAIKFNREDGSVTIRHEREGSRDRITVTDTGEGIPPEHINRIFERFYRVDRAREREMGGTGLGLAIVKHLARAHGGEVSVQSTLGEGSTFVIELPAIQDEVEDASYLQSAGPMPERAAHTLQPKCDGIVRALIS